MRLQKSMTILEVKALSNKIKEEARVEVEQLQKESNIAPGLAVILVGDDAASATYVGTQNIKLVKMLESTQKLSLNDSNNFTQEEIIDH